MKQIKNMKLEELNKEKDELWVLLSLIEDTGTYDMFDWNGLDYWDASRRHHRVSKEIVLRNAFLNVQKKFD
jgi:hypothetical protein